MALFHDLAGLHELSPTELSKYAFELEKKAMQLAVEEGMELVCCLFLLYMNNQSIV